MADITASVLTRLKNKSKETGRSYQLCLQIFRQEKFLCRLEKSKYTENFVLKGELLKEFNYKGDLLWKNENNILIAHVLNN